MKTFLLLVLLSFQFRPASAQLNMTHHLGINFSALSRGQYLPLYSCIAYSPRLNFKLVNQTSLSLSAPVLLGGNLFSNLFPRLSNTNDDNFLIDLPLLLEFGLGHLANRNDEANIGLFAGAGGCYTILTSYYRYTGYQFNAGLRFSGNSGSQELRFSYGGGIGNYSAYSKLGVSFLYYVE
jgi:hypothetical protein